MWANFLITSVLSFVFQTLSKEETIILTGVSRSLLHPTYENSGQLAIDISFLQKMSIGVPAGSLGDLSDHCDDLRGVDNMCENKEMGGTRA